MHLRPIRAFFYFREKGSLTMNIENISIALLLLGVLITVLCVGINLYRLLSWLAVSAALVERCMLGYALAGAGVQLFRAE